MIASADRDSRISTDEGLTAAAELAVRVRRMPWFAAVGDGLLDAEVEASRRYLAALGVADVAVAGVRTWAEAERISRDPQWDRRWWDAEESARLTLLSVAKARFGKAPTVQALTRVTDEATAIVLGAASTAALRMGVTDHAIAVVAAGAATQACYQAALALLAGAAPEHPFALKFRLFKAGRWPLGIVKGTFHLF